MNGQIIPIRNRSKGVPELFLSNLCAAREHSVKVKLICACKKQSCKAVMGKNGCKGSLLDTEIPGCSHELL